MTLLRKPLWRKERSRFRTDKGLLPNCLALPAASAPVVQPRAEEIKTEELLFADDKEDEVKGPDQFKPIDYERDPEDLAPASLRPTPENTVAPMEKEPFDMKISAMKRKVSKICRSKIMSLNSQPG